MSRRSGAAARPVAEMVISATVVLWMAVRISRLPNACVLPMSTLDLHLLRPSGGKAAATGVRAV
jgi:hypothetical protein